MRQRSLRRGLLALVLSACAVPLAFAQGVSIDQGPNLGTYHLGPQQITLSASGGTGSYIWEVTAGALPPGMSLRTDPDTWFPPNASAGLIGVATAPGTYGFTLRVTSGGAEASRAFTMRISPLVIQDSWDLPEGFVGRPYVGYTLTAVNNTGAVTWTAANPLPPGMVLSADGVLSGTPTASGFHGINLRAQDSTDAVFRWINLQVYDIAITTPALLPNATQFVPYNAQIEVSGGSAPYTFSTCTGLGCQSASAGLPTGLVIDESTGVISGTPTAGSGQWGFTVTVTDSLHRSYSKRMAIVVIGAPPRLHSIDPYGDTLGSCTLGWPCNLGVGAYSGGTAPFTWTAEGLPPGMSLRFGEGQIRSWMNPADADVWGAPTEIGLFDVTITATDANGISTSNTYPLRVVPVVISSWPANGTAGVPYFFQFRPYGGPSRPAGPGAAVSDYRTLYTAELLSGRLPSGLTIDTATFVLGGTTDDTGWHYPTFRFTDLAGNAIDIPASIFIEGAGGTTIQFSTGHDLGTIRNDTSVTRQLFACCAPTLAFTALDPLPPGITLSQGGLLSGLPTTEGTYSFRVRVEDATFTDNFAIRRFTLIVGPEDPFTITTVLPFSYANVGTPISVSQTYTNAVGPVTWTVAPGSYLPPGISVAADGTLGGTPTSSGQYSFTIMATDAAGAVATRFFNISIYPPGVAPPLNLPLGPTFNAGFGSFTLQLSATGGTGPYRYSLTPGAPEVPGMRVLDGQPLPTFITSTGAFAGVLATAGSFPTSIRVTDAAGATFDRPITINVSDLSILSDFTPPRAAVGEPYAFELIPYGGSGNYAWSASGLPAGLSLDPAGAISGTPAAHGTFFPRITLTDLGTGRTLFRTLTFNVNPFPITTSPALPVATAGVPYSQALEAPGCGTGCVFSGNPGLGLTLSADGTISGTPTGTATSSWLVTVTGSNGTAQKLFTLQVGSLPLSQVQITTTTIGPHTVGASMLFGLNASGGRPPYSWTLRDGDALPPGIRLVASGGEASANAGAGRACLTGAAMQVGVYAFTLDVTDADGATASRTFAWNVSALFNHYSSLPLSNTTLTYGVAYDQPLLAVGGTGVYTWTTAGPMPPGLTLDAATGIVSGTPSNTGTFNVSVQITDEDGNSTAANIGFTIAGPTGAVLTFASGPTLGPVPLGSTPAFTVTPFGGTGPVTVTALTPLPAGFALQSGATLPGTFAPGTVRVAGIAHTAGTFAFTLQAQDAAGNIGVRTFTLTVLPLRVLTTSLSDGTVGVPYAQTLTALAAGAVAWSVAPGSSLPPGLALSADGLISGTPTRAAAYSFTARITDGTGAALSQTINLRISRFAIADNPLLPHAIAGTPYSHTFTATGGTGLVWSATGLPPGFAITPAGTLSGTAFSPGGSSFSVMATDGVTPVTKMFTLAALLSNPTILDYPLTSGTIPDVPAGQFMSFLLTANGGVPPYSWSVAPGSSLPSGLRLFSGAELLAGFPPGSTVLAGVPGVTGVYAFDLIATDGEGTELRRTFQLNVTEVAILPGGPAAGVAGAAYAQQFVAVGGAAPYTFTIVPLSPWQETLPPGYSMSPEGLLSGTTTSTGTYSFALQVADAAGRTFSRRYTLTISNTLGLRVLTSSPGASTTAGTSRSIPLTTNGTSTYDWSLASGSLPPGMQIQSDDSVTELAGVPSAPGDYAFTVRATDTANSANVAERAFTLRVSSMQLVAPRFQLMSDPELPPGQVGTAYSYAFRVAGGTAPYSFAHPPQFPLPPGLALSGDGVLSGVPEQIGAYWLAPTVTDAAGQVFQAEVVRLVVSAAGTPPPLVLGDGEGSMPSVGAPYVQPLDSVLLRGGTRPYSWVAAAGVPLPPGVTIVPGANGIENYAGGIPTAAGEFAIALVATDAAGKTLEFSDTLEISPIALTPQSIPSGRVGVAYDAVLLPSGGTAPYTLRPVPWSDMPVGLSLTEAGVLSGTPVYAGNFQLIVHVTDAAGNEVVKVYPITIDNASGEAPAVRLAADGIHLYHEIGSPAPVNTPVSITATSGALPYTLSIAGVPNVSLTSTAGTAPGSSSLALNVTGLTAGTYAGVLGLNAPGSANGIDAIPVILTVAPRPACEYSLLPPSSTTAAAGGFGSFMVSTAPACAWTATSSQPWLLIMTGSVGSGTRQVSYRTLAHAGASSRTAAINVNGKLHTVTQFGTGCSFGISPVVLAAPSGGGNASITVTASGPSCAWSADGLGASPASGVGSGTVNISVPANPDALSRVLTATIAGQTLTVNQTGVGCTTSLSPYSAGVPAAGGSGAVTVTTQAGCAYDTVAGPNWISITSGGSGVGAGTLVYSVEANSSTSPRSGTLSIGGQPFQITQDGAACSVTVNTSGLGSPFGVNGGAGSIGVNTNGATCAWNASTDGSWISLSSAGGTGNGTLDVTIASNAASAAERSAAVIINGQGITITQSGTICTYSLQSASGSVPGGGGTGTVGVVAATACGWTAATNDPDWLTIVSSGTAGSSDVRFAAAANTTAAPRTGTLSIAGLTYTVNQAGAPCSYSLPVASTSVAADGLAASSFDFSSALAGCTPEPVSYAEWLTVSGTTASGGTGTVTYAVAPNLSAANRVGTIQVGDRTFTVTQLGGQCGFSLDAYGVLFPAAGGSRSLRGSQSALGCTPAYGTDQPTFVTLGDLTGPVNNIFTLPYTVSPYNSLTVSTRRARINLGGATLTIKQTSY